ncbi:MAG TPA: MBL fold metallo-hydrolase [Vicinamibacterales bacterium]|nr:MBL fold metallo-hydrolase [Vicinamibacterales bacterium]
MHTPSIVTIAACALTASVLINPAFAQRGPLAPPMVKEGATEKISDHVYVIPDGSVPLVPNVAIIVGSRATLVVDTGLGARNGEVIMREVGKVSKNRGLYLAVTHFHPEHDLGAGGFPANTKMLRSRDQQADIDEFGLQTAKQFASFSPLTGELLQGAEFRKADQFFDKELTIDLGGVRVRLMAMGPNHTRGDIAFWVEPDSILVSGDVVMSTMPAFGSPYSKLSVWLQSLDRFEQLKPRRIVPAHGPMGDTSMIVRWKTLLTTVRARATALKKEGKSLDDTVKTIQDELQDKYPRNGMAGALRAAYNEAP